MATIGVFFVGIGVPVSIWLLCQLAVIVAGSFEIKKNLQYILETPAVVFYDSSKMYLVCNEVDTGHIVQGEYHYVLLKRNELYVGCDNAPAPTMERRLYLGIVLIEKHRLKKHNPIYRSEYKEVKDLIGIYQL